MISINASYTNLVNQRTLATNTKNLQRATERLSTGVRVNHANDDAAAMFVGSSLSSSLSGMKIAYDNTMLASNFLNIANGALNEVSDNLMRMNTLATQACSGILSDDARGVLQAEMQGLADQIKATINGATMNGVSTIKRSQMSADLMNEVEVKTQEDLIKAGYVACTAENLANDEITDYYISSLSELKALGTYCATNTAAGKKFVLTEDLDFSGTTASYWTFSGSTGIGRSGKFFQGEFDGNGHVISNMKARLFGYTKNAVIKNLGIENAKLSVGKYSGILAGDVTSTTFTNCYTTGSITSTAYGAADPTDGQHIGGLVGSISGSTISNCYSTANVTGAQYVGGLVGRFASSSTVTNSYATGNVKGSDVRVGGLIGSLQNAGSEVQNCYATGNVEGLNYVGGLVGYASDSAKGVSFAYATGNVKGTGAHAGGLMGGASSNLTTGVSNVYATGNVEGNTNVGGLIGLNNTTKISNAYTTSNVKGTTSCGLLFGNTGANVSATTLYYMTTATVNGALGGALAGESSTGNVTGATSISDRNLLKGLISWDSDIWDTSGNNPMIKNNFLDLPEDSISFQIGDKADENSSITYNSRLKMMLGNINVMSIDNARTSLEKIQSMMTAVNKQQSYIGIQLNRLTGIAISSQMTIENYSAAKSTVMDTDVTKEAAEMTKSQILQQISVAVLTQSKNISGQIALNLIK